MASLAIVLGAAVLTMIVGSLFIGASLLAERWWKRYVDAQRDPTPGIQNPESDDRDLDRSGPGMACVLDIDALDTAE
jgi:hypothetical protein